MRLIRSDGHALEQRDAVTRLPIGQVAGMPTPEQYERAAAEALERARVARESTRFARR